MADHNTPLSEVPEVADFVEAQERIQRLKDAYPEVFEQLAQLKEDYNAKLEAADKAVRAKQISCGPFSLMSVQTKYNADKLYEELGRSTFLAVGGAEKTVTELSVDRARLEAAIAAGKVPQKTVDKVRDTSPRYKKPEKIII